MPGTGPEHDLRNIHNIHDVHKYTTFMSPDLRDVHDVHEIQLFGQYSRPGSSGSAGTSASPSRRMANRVSQAPAHPCIRCIKAHRGPSGILPWGKRLRASVLNQAVAAKMVKLRNEPKKCFVINKCCLTPRSGLTFTPIGHGAIRVGCSRPEDDYHALLDGYRLL